MNRSASTIAYGNACITALVNAVLVLLPLHGIVVIGQLVASTVGIVATVALFAAARRIERDEKAASR